MESMDRGRKREGNRDRQLAASAVTTTTTVDDDKVITFDTDTYTQVIFQVCHSISRFCLAVERARTISFFAYIQFLMSSDRTKHC